MSINRKSLIKYRFFGQLKLKHFVLILVSMGLFIGLSWPILTINAISFDTANDAVNIASNELFLAPNKDLHIFTPKIIQVVVTAYSSEEEQTDEDPFTTASGVQVADGIIASNDLPFGTRVQFPSIYGDKIFVVADRMNERYTDRNHIDIWMEETYKAVQFGVKQTYAVVLD